MAGVEPALPKEHDFESCASANSATSARLVSFKTYHYIIFNINIFLEAATGLEPVVKVLQTSALPLGYAAKKMERKTRFEFATPTLARWCSTTELLPFKLDSNQRMTESKSVALPLGYSPILIKNGATDGNRTHECLNHNQVR